MFKICVVPQKIKQNKKTHTKIIKIKNKIIFLFFLARRGLYLAPTYFHLENQG